MSALKELGKGKQTKREEMIEALELERQGRGDERTKEILYEEREVKDYHDYEEEFGGEEESDQEEIKTGGFIDNRPSKVWRSRIWVWVC